MSILIKGIKMPIGGKRLSIDIYPNGKVCTNLDLDCKQIATAADVRPVVRGRWTWDENGMDWGIGAWRCSACGVRPPMWWNTERTSPMYKNGHCFCPNCGAEMEGVDG